MKTDTTDGRQLQQLTAGGDGFIRTHNKVVKGLAITTQKNPEAPEIIVVGKGKIIEANAERFLEQGQNVPVYIKQGTNEWKYAGECFGYK